MGTMRCEACFRKLKQAKLIRVGDERIGPFCSRCAEDILRDVQRQGMTVTHAGNMPEGAAITSIEQLALREQMADATLRHCQDENVQHVFLWDLPEEEFPAWVLSLLQELPADGQPECNKTHTEYRQNLTALKRKLESNGIPVHLVRASVAEVQDACRENGVPYNPQGRVQAVTMLGLQQVHAGMTLD